MRLSTAFSVLAVFGLAAGGAYVSARAAALWVETSTADEVANRLKVDGFDWATVETDGLQVVLNGEAASEADRFRALSSVGSVVDAARIFDNFTIAEVDGLKAPEFSIEVLRNDSGISLIGLVPADMDKDAFLEQIASRAPGIAISDFLETADYPVPDRWDDAVNFGTTALGQLERTKITIQNDGVFVKASTDSEADKRRLESNLARRAPDGLTTELRLTAPRPVITPFILRFQIADGQAKLDACSADSPETADRILAAAAAAGLEGQSSCRQGLGVPSPDWADAATASISALAGLGGGKVTLSDTDVGLVGVPGSDQAAFDAAAAGLDAALPPAFSLSAVLPELILEGDAKPTEFTATLSPEGSVQMRGAIDTEKSRDIMNTFAKAKFTGTDIRDAVEINDKLPDGWTIRVLSGLEALGELESGAVEVTPAAIAITGRSGNPNIGATVSQALVGRLGEGANFDLNVDYDPLLDPVSNRLDPKECVREIVALTNQRKITFEPGSTVLDGASRATVDLIAKAMGRCPEAEIEISGHTDSQGSEDMNLSLSKDRADAVLQALQLRRVEVKTLVAQGYGETQPIATNDTAAGREDNRRIEFRLITATPEPLDDGAEEDTENEQN